jgi:hypothetical protein
MEVSVSATDAMDTSRTIKPVFFEEEFTYGFVSVSHLRKPRKARI